ncbi:MAG TPA: type II secretion system F family protein [Kiloniellales bacterium]|nr:type II secretion system F family protein [Kiloniellales bacterium]
MASANLPALLAAIAVFLLCMGAGYAMLQAAARRARLKSAAGFERQNRLVQLDQERALTDRFRREVIRFMQTSTGRMNLIRDKQATSVRQRLIRAGFRGRDAIHVYIFLKVAGPILLGGGVAFFIFVLRPMAQPVILQLAMVLGGALAGSFLPDILLKNFETRRKTAIRRGLPDALDLLVICAEAGLSLDAAMARVAEEMERGAPVLGDELKYTCIELRFIGDRRKALENLTERVDLPAIRALTSTFIQTEKYGTPLAQALRVLSAEQRKERMLRAEEKAARLPAIMTVPLIIFVLPALFVVLIGPGALTLMDRLLSVW